MEIYDSAIDVQSYQFFVSYRLYSLVTNFISILHLEGVSKADVISWITCGFNAPLRRRNGWSPARQEYRDWWTHGRSERVCKALGRHVP